MYSDCSCHVESCSIRGDCCFSEMYTTTQNKSIDKGPHYTCTYPVATTLTLTDRMYFTAYYMVTKNPVEGCRYSSEYIAQTGIDPDIDCGDLNIAPWGSLLPVYSRKTMTIYKNRHCAECYEITDAVLWNATIFCKSENYIKTKINVLSLDLPFCHPSFLYESQDEDLKREECFIKLIDDCPQNFEVSPTLNLSRKVVGDACTGGLYSPFKKLYRNVFCYICNNDYLKMKCSLPREGVQHNGVVGYNGPRLLGSLDYGYLQMIENSSRPMDEVGQRACAETGGTIVSYTLSATRFSLICFI